MRNPKMASTVSVQQNNEDLVIVFQNFNGVFLAKISNSKDKETYAYGSSETSAQENAIKNYNLKYSIHNYKSN